MSKIRILKPFPQQEWETWVGLTVEKRSGKPFKSGKKQGIVITKTINPFSNKSGFLMDDGMNLIVNKY